MDVFATLMVISHKIFMCVNMAVFSLALVRSTQREQGIEAQDVWQQAMDKRFSDERLAGIYPNMIQGERPPKGPQ